MRMITMVLFLMLLSLPAAADNFVSLFMEQCAEVERPLNNVNIGRTMLEKMASNTDDEELKNTFKQLNSIRIVSSDSEEDSRYYYKKANELMKNSFADYEEAVSMTDMGSKITIWIKQLGDGKQDLILISLESDGKLFIINVNGKIDFDTISKLSGSIREGARLQ